MLLTLPESRQRIFEIQSARKKHQFKRAKLAKWYQGKLDHIDGDRLDDPEVCQKIPIVDKEILRKFSHDEFMDQFCIASPKDIAEYWRSGGTTGAPVF